MRRSGSILEVSISSLNESVVLVADADDYELKDVVDLAFVLMSETKRLNGNGTGVPYIA